MNRNKGLISQGNSVAAIIYYIATVLGAGQKVKRGVGRRKMGGDSSSFEPCKGVGHPIFQPVVVGRVMIVSDKV